MTQVQSVPLSVRHIPAAVLHVRAANFVTKEDTSDSAIGDERA